MSIEMLVQEKSVQVKNTNDSSLLLAKWQRINLGNGPSPRSRHGHKAVAIKELIIVYGGGNEGIFDDLYVFNTTSDMWYKPAIRGDAPPGLAAFAMCCDGEKIFIFGGMVDPNRYSNELYELDTRRWEYKLIRIRAPRSGDISPVARIGHSFNIDSDGFGYVFGGYANEVPAGQHTNYLNDFYRVKLDSALGILAWENLPTTNGPLPRESHSAVIFEQNGTKQLIIYGGMNGDRLSDIWICNLRSMQWQQIEQHGIAPLGRSLHSANLINQRMYIFGGWVSAQGEEVIPSSSTDQTPKQQWKCSNDLCCFDLKTQTWETFAESLCENVDQLPKPRAGHCAVVVHNRIYIWSGREGVRKMMNTQICCNDMYYLETAPPAAPEHLQLVRATMNGVEIQWAAVPTANEYLLQISKISNVEVEQPANPPLPNILQSRNSRAIRPQTSSAAISANTQQQLSQNGQVTRFYLTPQTNAVVRMVAPSMTPTNTLASSSVSTAETSETLQQSSTSQSHYNSKVGNYSFTTSSTVTSSVTQQMPNNILDESFSESDANLGESMDEPTANTTAQSEVSPSKLVDPASISLGELAAESSSSSEESVSVSTGVGGPPADPEPSQQQLPNEESSAKAVVEPCATTGDVPADPQSAQQQKAPNINGQAEDQQQLLTQSTTPQIQAPLQVQLQNNGQLQAEVQEEIWHNVGIIKKMTSYLVTHYFIDDNPNEAERRKTALEPGTQYKFRVAAANSCGQSGWSPEASFRTCIPGYPGAPSSIKITKGQDCARLNWAPPSTPNGTICEYSVYLAMRTPDTGSPFLRVYAGQEPSCTVPNKTLTLALIDNTPKPAVIFRIAARNEKGYGPATQVRWLQDNRAPLPRPSSMQTLHAGQAPYNKRIRLD